MEEDDKRGILALALCGMRKVRFRVSKTSESYATITNTTRSAPLSADVLRSTIVSV
jgi:hypothetical protein